jgi:hypothetical protein
MYIVESTMAVDGDNEVIQDSKTETSLLPEAVELCEVSEQISDSRDRRPDFRPE